MGAQICIFCSCESSLLSEHKLSAYRAMPISRATENGIYLLMANTSGNPQNLADPGSSHGNVIDEAGYFENRLVSAVDRLRSIHGFGSQTGLPRRDHLERLVPTGRFRSGHPNLTSE